MKIERKLESPQVTGSRSRPSLLLYDGETSRESGFAIDSAVTKTTKNNTSALPLMRDRAPQVKQHGAGNLTGVLRKVKDLAADLHNLIKKWKTLQSQGMNIITDIANIMMNKVLNSPNDEVSSGPKPLPSELTPLCDSLAETVDAMESIVLKMQTKETLSSGLVSLQNFQKSKPASNVLFSTMTLEDIAHTVKAIEQDYTKELQVKREISKTIAHAESRDAVMLYLASWTHEPYIHEENADWLKGLLKDTGHIK